MFSVIVIVVVVIGMQQERVWVLSEWFVFRRWWRSRSNVCARNAGSRVNWIFCKQQRLRACSGRAGVNGHEHAFVRLDRAPRQQRARAGWAGGG